jgi:3-dehydroquinate dehydratase
VRAWVITRHRFEHDEETGAIMRRHEEVERLDGDLPAVAVAVMLELRYARLYQPQWDEATGRVDDAATISMGSSASATNRNCGRSSWTTALAD